MTCEEQVCPISLDFSNDQTTIYYFYTPPPFPAVNTTYKFGDLPYPAVFSLAAEIQPGMIISFIAYIYFILTLIAVFKIKLSKVLNNVY